MQSQTATNNQSVKKKTPNQPTKIPIQVNFHFLLKDLRNHKFCSLEYSRFKTNSATQAREKKERVEGGKITHSN